MIRLVPLSIEVAEAFLRKHGRHYKAASAPLFAIGVKGGVLHGAVIVGQNKNGEAELSHIYADGVSSGYTLLYGAAWQAIKALGHTRITL